MQRHCSEAKFAICDYVHQVHDGITDDEFLWDSGGIWKSASPAMQERLRREETRFVLAVVRAYPREQLSRSAANFAEQLTTFGLWDYGPNPYVVEIFDKALPGRRAQYLQSRQAHVGLPDEFSSAAQTWSVLASIVIMVGVAAFRLWRLSPRLLPLSAIIISMTVANALVTGVLSNVEDRYQSRVIWLLPLLAGVLVMDWLGKSEKGQGCEKSHAGEGARMRSRSQEGQTPVLRLGFPRREKGASLIA